MTEIRVAESNDARDVCFVIRRSIQELCAPDYENNSSIMSDWLSNKTVENITEWIESKSNYPVVCEDQHHNILGFALMNSKGEILLLYVSPDFQSIGIGNRLLKALEDHAIIIKCESMIAYSTITAKKFYEKHGFTSFSQPVLVGNILGEFPLKKLLS